MLGSAPPDLPPRRNISPGQMVPVLTASGWADMRWGIIPVGRKNARGRPVMETIINARSETAFTKSAFEGLRRAVVPASGWYEWTGERRRKAAWDICRTSGPLLFAALWDDWQAPGGQSLKQIATLTCEPNTDVAPIHHRMGVILDPSEVPAWLSGADPAPLMVPLPEGMLRISEAQGVDWDAP